MRKFLFGAAPLLFLAVAVSSSASAGQIAVGYLQVDFPASSGDTNSYEFDVVNQTYGNNTDGPPSGCCTGGGLSDTFPIATTLLTNVSNLTVTAADGSTTLESLGSAYFGLSGDGQSLTGGELLYSTPSTASNTPGSAILTGTFSATSVELDDGTMVTILPGFSVTLTDPSSADLMDGDVAVIYATTAGSTSSTPEPGTWLLLGTGLLLLGAARSRKIRNVAKIYGGASVVLLALALMPHAQAATTAGFRVNTFTNPSSGVAGSTIVTLSTTNAPAGATTSNTTLAFASSCGGSPISTVSPSAVTSVISGTYRIQVQVPAALSTTGNYFITVTIGSAVSTDCSEITVTVPVKFSGACLPSSSIGLGINTTTSTATAYVPNGAWDTSNTGIQIVQLEPAGVTPVPITTPDTINACSASPSGQAACTANNADVYVINGTTPYSGNPLISGSDTTDSFSGGACMNCGIAINPSTNQAVISMGFSGGAGGYQFLNLGATPSFVGPPIGVANEPSENIVWDATRDLILSPNEQNNYDVLQVGSGATTAAEFGLSMGTGGSPDSAGEDCATGIAVSTVEFTDQLFFADLTQAVFTPPVAPGGAGTWSAPNQVLSFTEFNGLEAGTSGMAVAPGSHLAVIAGEFTGNQFGVVQLPSTSGSGTPAPTDYVAATLPDEPDGCIFEGGLDPHTVTAYSSPATGKALAVMADGYFTVPEYLAVVDMAALLAAPRNPGTHTVSSSVDLIGTGIVSYVPTGNPTSSCVSSDESGSLKSRSRVKGASVDRTAPTPENHKTNK